MIPAVRPRPAALAAVALALLGLLVVLAPPRLAQAGYGQLGTVGQASTTATTTVSSSGVDYQVDGLCVPVVADGSRRLKISVSVRVQAQVGGLTADVRIRRDPYPGCPTSGAFAYPDPPAGGSSVYLAAPGGPGATTLTPHAQEITPPGAWTYRITLVKTAGPAGTVNTGATGYSPQQLLVEDIGPA